MKKNKPLYWSDHPRKRVCVGSLPSKNPGVAHTVSRGHTRTVHG